MVRPLSVSVVPLDSSQLLRRKVVPDQGKHREKPSAALSHLRLPLPSWDLTIRQKRQILRSLPFPSSFHLPVLPISFRQQPDNTGNQSDLCSPVRHTWIFGEMQMGKKELCPHLSSDTFYENLNNRPRGIWCSYHLTTLRLPNGFHSGSG